MGVGGSTYLAPDGNHFMWSSPWAELYIATMDDKGVSKTEGIGHNHWIDGKHWVELIVKENMFSTFLTPPEPFVKVNEYIVGSKKPTRTVAIAEGDPLNIERAKIGIQSEMEFVTPDYRLLYANWDGRKNVATQIITETPLLKKGVSRRLKIKIPPETAIDDIAFSPDGKRIAWQLRTRHIPALASEMIKKFPNMEPCPHPIVSLWVSAIDGSGMHQLDQQTTTPEAANEVDDAILQKSQPVEIRWLPNSKTISFIYQNSLWKLDAN